MLNKKNTTIAVLCTLLILSNSCGKKEGRDIFNLTIVTNNDLSKGNKESMLPKDIIDILNPLNLENCNQAGIARYWKANAKLLRADIKEQKFVQVSPNYATDLTTAQDSLNYFLAVRNFRLTDDIFSTLPVPDSNYYQQNVRSLLKSNPEALKIVFNSTDSALAPNNSPIKYAANASQVRSLISDFLCSNKGGRQIIVFIKTGTAATDLADTLVAPKHELGTTNSDSSKIPKISKKQVQNQYKPPIRPKLPNLVPEIDPTTSKGNKIQIPQKDIKQ